MSNSFVFWLLRFKKFTKAFTIYLGRDEYNFDADSMDSFVKSLQGIKIFFLSVPILITVTRNSSGSTVVQ